MFSTGGSPFSKTIPNSSSRHLALVSISVDAVDAINDGAEGMKAVISKEQVIYGIAQSYNSMSSIKDNPLRIEHGFWWQC